MRGSLCSTWGLDGTSFTWDNRWGAPQDGVLTAGGYGGDSTLGPPGGNVFVQSRRWGRVNPFVAKIINLRLAFIYHGLLGQVERPLDAKKPEGEMEVEWHPGIQAVDRKDRDVLKEWKRKNAGEIQRVFHDIGKERLTTRNVVALWQPASGRVTVRPPEECSYTDKFGSENLTIRLNLTADEINKMNIAAAAKQELLKSPKTLTLTRQSAVFKFRVLKDELVGLGFGWPDLATLFHACSLDESLLVGDRQLADACRTVYEQHLLGHDIKSGPHAGSPAHFANEVRRKGTLKEVKETKGHKTLVTNFDHQIKIGAGRPETSQYDAARYKASAEHLALWGVPYAQMWSGTVNPFLMTLARQDAAGERRQLQPFLVDIVREGMRCPVDVFIRFEDSCFWDSRLLLDVLKIGLAGGPLSQGTFLNQTGFSQADELARKKWEALLPEKIMQPAFDAAHGIKEAPGKPPGRNDKS